MNPYLNSLNGFGGGFIAFWPTGGVVVVTAAKRIVGFHVNLGRMMNR